MSAKSRLGSRVRPLFPIGVALLVLALAWGFVSPVSRAADAPTARQSVRQAWQRAQASGAYHFSTEIVQTTYPAPSLANVGRSSHQETLYIEGRADVPRHDLRLTLWTGGGSVLNPRDGIEVHIAGDRAYGRQIGGSWEEVQNFANAFAPGSDLMAYMVGAQNVRRVDAATEEGGQPMQYAFDVNGPAFAEHLRAQLEEHFRRSGQLPAGVTLGTSEVYRDITGEGQLWIDADGLPRRLAVHLVYPPERGGGRVEASIRTDFADFAPVPASRLGWSRWGLPVTEDVGRSMARQATLLAAFLGLLVALLRYRKSRPVYATFVLVTVFSMVGVPLVQSQRAYAFAHRMTARQAEQEQQRSAAEAAREARNSRATSDWDPHHDPLAREPVPGSAAAAPARLASPAPAPACDGQVADADEDGLTCTQEAGLGTNPQVADSDRDGLDDGVEVLRLGTDPNAADSDGDGITDYLEVRGFVLAGGAPPWYSEGEQRWYSDPLEADTNRDGLIDGDECPQRARPSEDACLDSNGDGILGRAECPQRDAVCVDTDHDAIPDLFDRDNDGDGVGDRIDLSPLRVMGGGSPFERARPFRLRVRDLAEKISAPGAYYPVFVDFQLRPADAAHLTYALNVLDWPGGDEAGQIQRRTGNDGTFADGMTPEQIEVDPRVQNGDTRLIPMLEIEIRGNPTDRDSFPLPWALAQTQVQLRGVDVVADAAPAYTPWLTATMELRQLSPGGAMRVDFDFDGPAAVDSVVVYRGTCDAGGEPERQFTNVADGAQRQLSAVSVTDWADGQHVVVLRDGDHDPVCAPIPDLPNGGAADFMLDTSALEPYGVSLRDQDNAGTVLAYVPLHVVADETGGGRAAFAARMLYHPNTGSLGDAQRVRMVWVVQMLTDACRPIPADYPEPQRTIMEPIWCLYEQNWSLDTPQVVHTYDDTWTLTGLSVREDRGLDVAVLYEDPAEETGDERQYDDWLWLTAQALEDSFISGRDQNRNGRRDLGLVRSKEGQRVADSRLTLNAMQNRWGLPATAPLRLEHLPAYEHQDHIARVMETETVRILEERFSAYRGAGADAPTLLFAREERYRAVGLDVTGSAIVRGRGLTVSLDPAEHKEETLALMSWAPYRYQDGRWQTYPIIEYWDRLELRLKSLFPAASGEPLADDIARGAAVVGQSLYLSLFQGRVGLVNVGGELLSRTHAEQKDVVIRETIGEVIQGAGKGINLVVTKVATNAFEHLEVLDFVMPIIEEVFGPGAAMSKSDRFFAAIGQGVKKTISQHTITKLCQRLYHKLGKAASIGLAVGMAVVAVAVVTLAIVGYALGNEVAAFVVTNAGNALAATLAIASAIKVVYQFATGTLEEVSKAAAKAGLIGLIISAVVTWGAFIAMMSASGVTPGTLAFNTALAGTIAATATLTIMFAIGAIPLVGQIIVAIVAAIDAVIFALCGAFKWGEGAVGQYVCKGLSGWISEGIQWTIYGANVIVDMTEAERLQLSQFEQTFASRRRGASVGNELDYAVRVTNTLRLSSIPIDWKAAAYFYQYNDGMLKTSTFDYQWMETDETDIHEDLARKDMTAAWQPSGEDHTFFITQDVATDYSTPLDEAGINRPISLYLAEGYAVPTQECWAVPIPPLWGAPPIPFVALEPVCYVRTEKATTHLDIGQSLKYDVFPATLDEFYALTVKNGGYSLGWGQSGDLTFARQKDADGDGLLNRADGGSDPDDAAWDFDGDGLSDAFEARHGTDNTQSDADADGLTDWEELLHGSDPARPDSDGDGLTDAEEIRGWLYVYAFDANDQPRATWVTADPNEPDSDGDGLVDLREKALGMHPRVLSDPNALHFESQVHEADAPLLLMRFETPAGSAAFTGESGESAGGCDVAAGTCPAAGVAGRYGAGVQFDGQGDVIALERAALRAEMPALTVAAWARGDQGTLFRRGSPGQPGYVELTLDWFAVGDDLLVYPGLALDAWGHLVATYGQGRMAVTLDGSLVAERDVTDAALAALGDGAALAVGQPSPVADRTCADLDLIGLFAQSVKDEPCVEPFYCDHTGEFLIELNDDLVTETAISVEEGGSKPVGIAEVLCGAGTVGLLEDDRWPNPDDDLGETVISASDTGAGSHLFSDAGGDTRVRLSWAVGPTFPVAYRHFDGALDELAVFDHALSAAEIERLRAGRYDPDDRIAVPGARLDYEARVENKLFARYAQGLLSTDFPLATVGSIDPQPFVLQPLEEQSFSGSVTVDADAGSARLSLTQVAGALVTDWRERSGFAELWLKLDEPFGATRFHDSSGVQPPRNATCTRDTCPAAEQGGTFGYAAAFDGQGQYLTLPKADQFGLKDGSFTVSAWFKADDLSGGDTALVGTDRRAQNRGLFLGFSGGKPHMGFYGNGMNSDFPVAEGQWYHVAYRYDATRQEMAIYVNGELRNAESGHAAFQGAGSVRLGRAHGGKYFDGLIDDVRIFRRPLAPEEIVALYTLPVLQLGFEEPAGAGGLEDASGFGNYGVCVPGFSCPLRTNGKSGQAALFDGSDYVGLNRDSSLDMSDGNFTMAAWIYPLNSGDSKYDTYAQGLWGRYSSTDPTDSPSSGAKWAYPSLLRVGRRLRFGFGTGDAWVYKTTSSNVLTVEKWNHVVVTYHTARDPATGDETSELVIYVDGQRVQSWALGGVRPASQPDFYVGRATDRGSVTIESLYVKEEHDPGSRCEPYITWDGTNILSPDEGLKNDSTWWINDRRIFSGAAVLKVWENDSSSADDYCGGYTYNTNHPGGSFDLTMSGGFDGELRTEYANPALPFRGRMDELTFYKRALNADEVNELYTAGTSGLYLRFDDAPGSTSFQNDAGRDNGICTGERCPTAGVAGRINQAASFDAGERDYVEVAVDASETSYGASLWFKTACANCGIFSADRGRLGGQGSDRHIYLDGGHLCAQVDGGNAICSTGVNYADGQWHHVAHTFGGAVGAQRLYADNALVASGTPSTSSFTDQDGLNVGVANAAAGDYFDGQVDEVQVFHRALSPARVEALFGAAPRFALHLDEAVPACAWQAAYYNNTTLSGDPVVTRCEDWDDALLSTGGSPAPGVHADHISARWQGDFVFQDGAYTFRAATGPDNAMRVWLDGDLLVDQWSAPGTDQVTRQMSAGVHALAIEYRHGTGDAEAAFTWNLFRDDAGSAVADPGALPPTPGQRGQLGLAAEFDGVADALVVPHVPELGLSRFTVGAWVMPKAVVGRSQVLLLKGDGQGDRRNYGLTLAPDGLHARLSFQTDAGTDYAVESPSPLVLNQWNHVVGTYDGDDLRIYVNGYLQNSQPAGAEPWQTQQSLRIGGGVTLGGESAAFAGRLDEVLLYDHALSAAEVRDTHLYQAKWVEERETVAVTVDAEPPSSRLRSYDEARAYRPLRDVVMHVEAQDPTSRVTLVELGAQREGAAAMTWLAASACTDATGDAAWCPVFDPAQLGGQGRYTLQTRAIDRVGHQETPTRTYTLYVDGAPPTVMTPLSEGELVAARPHPTRPNAWLLSLSGTVADPLLPGDYPGSGVVTDSLRVTLFDAETGAVAGTGPQRASVAGGAWAVDVLFLAADPGGAYTVTAEVEDQVGNRSAAALVTVHVDTAGPLANLNLATTDVTLDETATLWGDVTERPVPLAVSWTTDASGDETGLAVVCNSQTLYTATAGTFAAATTYTWEGATHHGATCHVALTDRAADGGVTGAVQVCGATVAAWDGNYGSHHTVPFTVDAPDCRVPPSFAGVDDVEAAFVPTLPGSPFYNAAPPAGQMMHLTFDAPYESGQAIYFHDVAGDGSNDFSATGHTGRCFGSRCPATRESGLSGSAVRFDGVGDAISLGRSRINRLTNDFTVMLWIKPDVVFGSKLQWLLGTWTARSYDGFRFGLAGGGLRFATPGHCQYNTTGVSLEAGVWTHVAAVMGADNRVTFYVDGAPIDGGPCGSPATPDTQDLLYLGLLDNRPYAGTMDEVQVFDRALSAAEVLARFHGAGPALALPFDESWAADGTALADASGRDHSVTLHTGAPTQAIVSGQAGAGALALDGVDDYVGVAPHPGLDVSGSDFTQAAWVYPIPEDDRPYPLWSGGAYQSDPRWRPPFIEVISRTHLTAGYGGGDALHTLTTGAVLAEGAWNHVAATHDGDTYRIYVNGVERASAPLTAPVSSEPLFDVGRGTPESGTPACATATLEWLLPDDLALAFRILWEGEVVYTSEPYPQPTYLPIGDITRDFCGSGQLAMERLVWGIGYSMEWVPMGTHTVDTTPGRTGHTFSDGDVSAIVFWNTTYDRSTLAYFRGRLDDVRMYPRALSPWEVAALAGTGWHSATVGQSGAGVDETYWHAPVPAGLEGAYRLDLRGTDLAGYERIVASPWRGDVDTLAPRVALTRTDLGSAIRYTTVAEDFNLTDASFRSPCGVGVVSERQGFRAPWYQTLSGQRPGGQQRLYRLVATCDVPVSAWRPETGACPVPSLAHAVAVSGTYAFAATDDGLQTVDLSDPGAPSPTALYTMPDAALGVALAGSYAVVPDGSIRLHVVDVSDPQNPQALGEHLSQSMGGKLAISGTLVYVPGTIWGLEIVDISTPANPVRRSNYYPYNGIDPLAVDVAGRYAYITTGGSADDYLEVVDVSDPDNPQFVSAYWLPTPGRDVVVSGTLAVVADGDAGLHLLDISDPLNVAEAGTFDLPGWHAESVALSGSLALVAAGREGAWGIDISDPANPQQVFASYATGGNLGWWEDHYQDVALSGGHALAVKRSGVLSVIPSDQPLQHATACDIAGHCTTVAAPAVTVQATTAQTQSAPVDVAFFSDLPAVLAAPGSVAIDGEAAAVTTTLRALTVTVDGGLLYTETWAAGTVSETAWSTLWTPVDEGLHTLRATVRDDAGHAAFDVITVTLDTQPPALAISSTLRTAADLRPPGALDLTGFVSDAGSLPSVRVTVFDGDGAAAGPYAASVTGDALHPPAPGAWDALWYPGAAPDGEVYTVTALATDIAGHTARVTETVVVDFVPPSPVTLTLRSDGAALAPGDVVPVLSPTLTLTWTAAIDGSGVSGYEVIWTVYTSGTVTTTVTSHAPISRTAQLAVPGEGQRVSVQVGSTDGFGQQRWQSAGPVFVDSPLTPDAIALLDDGSLGDGPDGYRAWMDAGCSLLGVDRRPDSPQRFYVTWDASALRLAWQGGNWAAPAGSDQAEGDLFVYLDVAPGGVITAFNPYSGTAAPTLYLPGATPATPTLAMAADYLVWVRDAGTALLLRWAEAERDWAFETALAPAAGHFRFDAAVEGGQTDLLLPWGLLGIADPATASLGLVALASEQDALRLWATMPPANPVSSARVANTADEAGAAPTFGLLHAYRWDGLGSGVCPNGSLTPAAPQLDADLRVRLDAAPDGIDYGFLGDDLFWLWDPLFAERPPDFGPGLDFLDAGDAPLADGQLVTYTVRYHNRGTVTATGVLAEARALYALRLVDGDLPERAHQLVALGDVGPGVMGSAVFTGVVDLAAARAEGYDPCRTTAPESVCAAYLRLASVDLAIYDDAHDLAGLPRERLWVDHAVDHAPPAFFGIQEPVRLIAPISATLRGYAYDDGTVPTITLEITPPPDGQGAVPQTLRCIDPTPADGAWSCPWDVVATNGGAPPADGDVFDVRLRASDAQGFEGAWSAWQPFVVDAVPPVVTLDLTATQVTTGSTLLGGEDYTLFGTMADNRGVGEVEVCVRVGDAETCAAADHRPIDAGTVHHYDDEPAAPIAVGAATPCGGGEIVRPISVTEHFTVGLVSFGFSAEHAHRDDLWVTLESPQGTLVELLADDGLGTTDQQHYDVWLLDAATGPYHAPLDDDPAAPHYERAARPAQPLRAFAGEGAAGTWTLRICDARPSMDGGDYRRARLALTPRDSAPRNGAWSYTVPGIGEADFITQHVTIHGTDQVGNRTTEPLSLTVVVDNVAPVITVTRMMTTTPLTATAFTVLAGFASDGGGLSDLFVQVQAPDGKISVERWAPSEALAIYLPLVARAYRGTGSAALSSATAERRSWHYVLRPMQAGRYRLWVTAVDLAGNVTTAGQFAVDVPRPEAAPLFLPLVLKNQVGMP